MDLSELAIAQDERNWYTEQKPCQLLEKILFWRNSCFKMFMLLKYIFTLSCALFACLQLSKVYEAEITASTW